MDEIIDTLAAKLSWEMEAWTSIELRVEESFVNHGFPNAPSISNSSIIKQHYIETASGQRRGEIVVPWGNNGEKAYIKYFDGTKSADVTLPNGMNSRQSQVIIKSSYATEGRTGGNDRPMPLKCFYVGKTPLYKAIRSAKYEGDLSYLGRDCAIFNFTNTVWANGASLIIITIDKEAAVPVRVHSFLDETSKIANEPLWTWEAKSLDFVDGHAFPLRSQEKVFDRSNKKSALMSIRDINVKNLSFNHYYDNSLFWPSLEPGVMVFDQLKKAHYSVFDPNAVTRTNMAPQSQTVQSLPPRDWTKVTSVAFIGLGVMIAIFAILYKYRRNRKK